IFCSNPGISCPGRFSVPADPAPLVLRDLAKSYGQRTVLGGIGLELKAGDYVAIMGESGVGKSPLLNLIAGLDRPDAGTIEIAGRNLAPLSADELPPWRAK